MARRPHIASFSASRSFSTSTALLAVSVLLLAAGAWLPKRACAQEAGASTETATEAPADTSAGEETPADDYEGRFERRDPQRSHLFASSTARPIGSGDVYASSTAIVLLQAGIGISERVSLQAGGAVGYDGNDLEYLFTARPKFTLLQTQTGTPSGGVPLSVALEAQTAALYGTDFLEGRNWDVAIFPRALATYGSPEAALTAGLGVPFTADDGNVATLSASLGGELQVLEWLKLITDNRVYLGAEQQFVSVSFDGEQFRTSVREDHSTIAEFTGGTRFMWDHFALETGIGGMAGEGLRADGTDLLVHLRLSYRF